MEIGVVNCAKQFESLFPQMLLNNGTSTNAMCLESIIGEHQVSFRPFASAFDLLQQQQQASDDNFAAVATTPTNQKPASRFPPLPKENSLNGESTRKIPLHFKAGEKEVCVRKPSAEDNRVGGEGEGAFDGVLKGSSFETWSAEVDCNGEKKEVEFAIRNLVQVSSENNNCRCSRTKGEDQQKAASKEEEEVEGKENQLHQQEQPSKLGAIKGTGIASMTGNPNQAESSQRPPATSEEATPQQHEVNDTVLALDVTTNNASAEQEQQHIHVNGGSQLVGFRGHPLNLEEVGGSAYADDEHNNLVVIGGESPRKGRHSRRYSHRHHPYAYGVENNVHSNFENVEVQEYNDMDGFQRAQQPGIDEYAAVRQYSPQGGRGEWPPPIAQHLQQVAPWVDSRNWPPATGPVGVVTPVDHNGRYMNQKSWLDHQRPSSAMSGGTASISIAGNAGAGNGATCGVGRKLAPSSPDAIIPDTELAELTVKELNKRVQNYPREDIVALKQRRRTLKNRG